jgi:hypothetical protein
LVNSNNNMLKEDFEDEEELEEVNNWEQDYKNE